MPSLNPVVSIVKPLQHYIKFPKIWIDNSVFRLHAKISVLICFLGSMVITAGQFFGSPISCIVDGAMVPQSIMNTYCWIHSTFTLPKNFTLLHLSGEVPHPGVGVYTEEDEIVNHGYYQWVCFILFFQGLMFLAPYQLWKRWEGGKVAGLVPAALTHSVSDPRMPHFATPLGLIEKEKLNDSIAEMRDYFTSRNQQFYREHRFYLMKFTFCEVLNFINVLLQLHLVNHFLGGVFTTYGMDVINMSQMDASERSDPLNQVFPKVAKCNFERYGPSGTIEKADGLCVLPLNIINEKFYILLWFWLVFLAVASGVQLAWRASTIASRRIREWFLRGKSYLASSQSDIIVVNNNLTLGDWFILVLISENIDVTVFSQLISQLSKSFRKMMDSSHVTFAADA